MNTIVKKVFPPAFIHRPVEDVVHDLAKLLSGKVFDFSSCDKFTFPPAPPTFSRTLPIGSKFRSSYLYQIRKACRVLEDRLSNDETYFSLMSSGPIQK